MRVDVPEGLTQRLKPNGRMLMPIGNDVVQTVTLFQKDELGQIHRTEVTGMSYASARLFNTDPRVLFGVA